MEMHQSSSHIAFKAPLIADRPHYVSNYEPPTPQSSPLLSLPAEIRNMIWLYAVGNKMIHISTCRDKYHLIRNVRRSPLYPHPYITEVTHLPPKTSNNMNLTFRTLEEDLLNPIPRQKCRWSRHPLRRFSIDILFANRQTYYEITPILYSSNVFSFHEAKAIRSFTSRLGAAQRNYVKAICISRTPLNTVMRPDIRDFSTLETIWVRYEEKSKFAIQASRIQERGVLNDFLAAELVGTAEELMVIEKLAKDLSGTKTVNIKRVVVWIDLVDVEVDGNNAWRSPFVTTAAKREFERRRDETVRRMLTLPERKDGFVEKK